MERNNQSNQNIKAGSRGTSGNPVGGNKSGQSQAQPGRQGHTAQPSKQAGTNQPGKGNFGASSGSQRKN